MATLDALEQGEAGGEAVASQRRVRQAEYARMRGMSPQRVHQLKQDGRIPVDEFGLVIVEQADANLLQLLDRSRAHRDRQGMMPTGLTAPAQPSKAVEKPEAVAPTHKSPASFAAETAKDAAQEASDYWAQKGRREAAEASLSELRLQEKLGELVRVADVRRSRHETAHKVANALMQLPARLGPVVAPQDPQRAETAMRQEIERILTELATDLAPGGLPA